MIHAELTGGFFNDLCIDWETLQRDTGRMHQSPIPVQQAGMVLDDLWLDNVRNKSIWVKLPSGRQGGLVEEDDGNLSWRAFDDAGEPVSPVEVIQTVGPFEKRFKRIRGERPHAKFIRFGAQPTPSGDGFFVSSPQNPLSIKRRKCLVFEGGVLGAVHNGFPYEKNGHFLLLQASVRGCDVDFPYAPQALTPGVVAAFFKLAEHLGDRWALAYNDLHAGATQNWLHAHALRGDPFPVERFHRVALGGGVSYALGYPAGVLAFEGVGAAGLWPFFLKLQESKTPCNMLVRGQTVFIYGRNRHFEMISEFPTGAMAVSELSGRLLLSDHQIYESLDAVMIRQAIAKTTKTVEQLLDLLF